MSWSCKGLLWESISMATAPMLRDSSCIRTELSAGRQQIQNTHVQQDQPETLNGRGEKQKVQRAFTIASYTRWESNVPGKYLLNLWLYSPGSHCAARELHAAPGPLFCGSLKYFFIFALQRTKYSNSHSQGIRAVPYYNSCCFEHKYTGSENVSKTCATFKGTF